MDRMVERVRISVGGLVGAIARGPWAWVLLRWVLIATCVFFAARGWVKAMQPEGSDFTIYYDAGRAVLAGRDPFSVYGFVYPVVFALFMSPLALLPYGIAAAVWQLGSLVALGACVRHCVALCTEEGREPHPALACVPLLCVLRLVDSNMTNGQVNTITLWICLMAIQAARKGQLMRSGAWIALGTATKVLPVFLLLPAILRRQWLVLASFAALLLALVLLLPATVLGWHGNLAALEHWSVEVVAPYAHGGEALVAKQEYVPGQSLTATAYRLLASTPATPPTNSTGWSPDDVEILVRVVATAMVLIVALTLLKRRAPPESLNGSREAALLLLTVLIVAPLVHKAHMVWSLLAFTYVVARAREWWRRRSVGGRIQLTLACLSALVIGATTPAILGRASGSFLLSQNSVFFGVLLLWLTLLIDTWRE